MKGAGPSLRVRAATATDLPLLAALEREGFPEPWSSTLLAADLREPTSQVLVAEEGGEVVGYASFRRAADEAELLRVAVTPRARNRGVGRRLVETGLRELAHQGITQCFLDVRRRNAPARALYRRLGFHEAGVRRAYYPDGSDALVLTRNLDPASVQGPCRRSRTPRSAP